MTTLLNVARRWSCPNCKLEQVTNEARPHTRFHPCSGLHGLVAPMIEAGAKVKVEAVERGDYMGDEQAGRYMAVTTTRQDGSNDAIVFAPTATGGADG